MKTKLLHGILFNLIKIKIDNLRLYAITTFYIIND